MGFMMVFSGLFGVLVLDLCDVVSFVSTGCSSLTGLTHWTPVQGYGGG